MICAIIPTYENPRTLRTVVTSVRAHIEHVVVIDDGSSESSRKVAEELATEGLCALVVRARNGGKGAAVKTGLTWAREHGFAQALQIDADLQHDPNDIPALLEAARDSEGALVLAQPVFDASAPRSRLIARKISKFWVAVETMSMRVGDPLCGFRIYPVELAERVAAHGDAMDFDPEIAVRLVWAGAKVKHVPTRVRYISREEGGISHFRNVKDTWLISLAHSRLCLEGIWSFATRLAGRRARA